MGSQAIGYEALINALGFATHQSSRIEIRSVYYLFDAAIRGAVVGGAGRSVCDDGSFTCYSAVKPQRCDLNHVITRSLLADLPRHKYTL
jgi:hypothetical protein